jgi:hypothetical protein
MYHGRIPPEEPPCETCRELPLKENEDALRIFYVVSNQFIMGFNGPVEICHQAIHEAMKLYRIRNRKECFEKVLTLSRWWIGEMTNKGE